MRFAPQLLLLLAALIAAPAESQEKIDLGRDLLKQKLNESINKKILGDAFGDSQKSVLQSKNLARAELLGLDSDASEASSKKIIIPTASTAPGVRKLPTLEEIRKTFGDGLVDYAGARNELNILNLRDLDLGESFNKYRLHRIVAGDINGGGPLNAALLTLGMKTGRSEYQISQAINAKFSDRTACPLAVATSLENARRALSGVPSTIAPANRLSQEEQRLRRYLSMPKAQIVRFESEEAIELIKVFELAWRDALDKCFDSPHETDGFATLKNRIGTFEGSDGVPFCTGLLLADGVALTARHCFAEIDLEDKSPFRRVKFRLADGKALLDIDTVSTKAVASPPYSWAEDQLLVKVPKLGFKLEPLRQSEDAQPFYSELPTTKLLLIAALPLARDLAPARFPTGFVISRQPDTCFIAFKRDACITHMCSVTPGSSGASIFSNEAEPKWLGIHVGPESKENSCSPTAGTLASNYAVRHRSSELAQFFK